MYSIRAIGHHGQSATEPAHADLDRAKTMAGHVLELRDVGRVEVLDPRGQVVARYGAAPSVALAR